MATKKPKSPPTHVQVQPDQSVNLGIDLHRAGAVLAAADIPPALLAKWLRTGAVAPHVPEAARDLEEEDAT